MLYDRLDNLDQYTGLFEHLDTCIDWIQNHDLNELPMGITELDGKNLYVRILDEALKPSEEGVFETHSNYMDLQIVLQGSQLFQVALGELTEKQPYDAERDCALYDGDVSVAGVLDPERFALFMVEEAHKPNVKGAECDSVKKAVFKIAR